MNPATMAMMQQQQGASGMPQQGNPFASPMGGGMAMPNAGGSGGLSEIDQIIADTNGLATSGNNIVGEIAQVDQTFKTQAAKIKELQDQNQKMQVAMATGQGGNPSMFAGLPGAGGGNTFAGGASNVDVATAAGDPVAMVKGISMDASSEANDLMAQMQTESTKFQIQKAQKAQLELSGIDPESIQGKQILAGMSGQNAAAVAQQAGPMAGAVAPPAGMMPQGLPAPQGVDASTLAEFGIDPSLMQDPSMGGKSGSMMPPSPATSMMSPDQYLAQATGGAVAPPSASQEQMVSINGQQFPLSLLVSAQNKLGGKAELESLLENGKIEEGQFEAATGNQNKAFGKMDLNQINQAARTQAKQAQAGGSASPMGKSESGDKETLTPEEMQANRLKKSRARMKAIASSMGNSMGSSISSGSSE